MKKKPETPLVSVRRLIGEIGRCLDDLEVQIDSMRAKPQSEDGKALKAVTVAVSEVEKFNEELEKR